jgi:hypothetical protein
MVQSSTVWITSKAAVERLAAAGISDPQVLRIWGHDGLLRSSAAVQRIAGKIERGSTTPLLISKGFWGELGSYPVLLNWVAGIFETYIDVEHEYGFQHAVWRMSGVKFAANDIEAQLTSGPAPRSNGKGFLKALSPATAKPSDKKYEPVAHAAAELMQAEGIGRAEAFRRVLHLVNDKTSQTSSIERAIRRAFDPIYDINGRPIKIDQN